MLLHSPRPTKQQSVIPSADIQSNEHNKRRQRELAVGKCMSNIARRMAQWAEPAIIINDESSVATDKQQLNKVNINEQESTEILTHPLLGGGQGKTNGNNNHTLLHPRGDISQRTLNQGNECQHLPHERDTPACPAEKSMQTRQPCGSSTDIKVQHTPERAVAMPSGHGIKFKGLKPPTLQATGSLVPGKDIEKLRLKNKWMRHALQEQQRMNMVWSTHTGTTRLPTPTPFPEKWRGDMCPSGIATSHPAGELLSEWAQMGCPTQTGRQWTKAEIWEAVKRGPHRSALSPEALQHFADEVKEKVATGQCKIVEWDSIKDSATAVKNIPHCRNTAQVTEFLVYLGSVVQPPAQERRNIALSKRHNRQIGTKRRIGSIGSQP
jgi:hypothetical protein